MSEQTKPEMANVPEKEKSNDDNEIIIKSLRSINEISGSKITNNSKYDNNVKKN